MGIIKAVFNSLLYNYLKDNLKPSSSAQINKNTIIYKLEV